MGIVSLYPHTGLADIGFSGSGRTLQFSFRAGKVYDFQNRYIHDLGSGEGIGISGNIATGEYSIYINDSLCVQSQKPDLGLQKFYVNTTGCAAYLSPRIFANLSLSNYDVEIQPSFYAGSLVTGRVSNNSDSHFRVFSSRISYGNADLASFSGIISGDVPARGGLNFTLRDLNSSRSNSTVPFKLLLDSSMGTLEKSFSVTRSGNLTGDLHIINDSSFNGGVIDLPLTGSGLPNSFQYRRPPSGLNISYLKYDRYSNSGEEKDKSLNWQVKPIYPTGNSTQTGSFISTYTVTNSGFYSERPYATFLDYSQVSGLSFNPNNLFSFPCGAILPVYFPANSGDGLGATGWAHLRLVNLPVYGGTKFYSVTGVTLAGKGTGYNYLPSLNVVSGYAGTGCFDVPRVSGNSYIYTPFTGTGILEKQAGYAYGELLTGSRILVISGLSRTGYCVSGLRITNVSSGFNATSGFNPSITIRRASTDLYSAIASASGLNASGTLGFNTSGDSYSFSDNWIFKTGKLFDSVTPLASSSYYGGTTGYSGSISFNKNEGYVYFYSYYKQAVFDLPVTVQWSFSVEQSTGKSVILTGRKFTTSDTGMLKIPNAIFNTGIYIEF